MHHESGKSYGGGSWLLAWFVIVLGGVLVLAAVILEFLWLRMDHNEFSYDPYLGPALVFVLAGAALMGLGIVLRCSWSCWGGCDWDEGPNTRLERGEP